MKKGNDKKNWYQAKKARQARIEELEQVNFRVSPTEGIDSGAYGKMVELAYTRSTDYRVSGTNRHDTTVKMTSGKGYYYLPLEIKTNGSRLGDFINSDTDYIVYGLNVCNAGTSYKNRFIPPMIFKKDEFLTLLDSLKGSTRIASKEPIELQVQGTSAKLYKALLNIMNKEPYRLYLKEECYNWLLE